MHVNDPMFGKHDIITVTNPTEKDFPFKVDGQEMVISAGANKKLPGMVANFYVKHMIDHLIISDNKTQKLGDLIYRQEVAGQIVVKSEKVDYIAPNKTQGEEARELMEELNKDLPEDKDFDAPEATLEDIEKLPTDEELYPAPKKAGLEEAEEEFPSLKEENLVKIPKFSELAKMNRKDLSAVAVEVGLDPEAYETNANLLDAIVEAV